MIGPGSDNKKFLCLDVIDRQMTQNRPELTFATLIIFRDLGRFCVLQPDLIEQKEISILFQMHFKLQRFFCSGQDTKADWQITPAAKSEDYNIHSSFHTLTFSCWSRTKSRGSRGIELLRFSVHWLPLGDQKVVFASSFNLHSPMILSLG